MHEIIIAGEARPIHFGLRAVNEFTKQHNIPFDKAVSTTEAVGSLESIVALTATALNEGARLTASTSRYTEDEVWDIFDAEPELILTVSELFVDSITPLVDKLGELSKNPQRPTGKSRRR